MSEEAQQGPPEEGIYGHQFKVGLRDGRGYAVCAHCKCSENTDESVQPCKDSHHPAIKRWIAQAVKLAEAKRLLGEVKADGYGVAIGTLERITAFLTTE